MVIVMVADHDHVILVSYCNGGGRGDNVHGKQTLWTKTMPEKTFCISLKSDIKILRYTSQ